MKWSLRPVDDGLASEAQLESSGDLSVWCTGVAAADRGLGVGRCLTEPRDDHAVEAFDALSGRLQPEVELEGGAHRVGVPDPPVASLPGLAQQVAEQFGALGKPVPGEEELDVTGAG